MFDKTKPYGTWHDADEGNGYVQNGVYYDAYGNLMPGQTEVKSEDLAPEVPAPPVDDDPTYVPVKPKVYVTQMNMRQLKEACLLKNIEVAPTDKKRDLVRKLKAAE